MRRDRYDECVIDTLGNYTETDLTPIATSSPNAPTTWCAGPASFRRKPVQRFSRENQGFSVIAEHENRAGADGERLQVASENSVSGGAANADDGQVAPTGADVNFGTGLGLDEHFRSRTG